MRRFRRFERPQSVYFLTAATFKREPLLLNDVCLFWQSWRNRPFIAWFIGPDHFHVLLENASESVSTIMHHFKITYSRAYRDRFRHGKVWQDRFWDHVIRDQDDFNRHVDYIHYNPVKHGLVHDPLLYPHCSFKEWFDQGMYEKGWGCNEREFGETSFWE